MTLTLIKPCENIKGRKAGLFRCSCGNEKRIRLFSVNGGKTKTCGEKRRHRCLADGIGAKNRALRQIRYGAKRRGYIIDLTDDDIVTLIAKDCYYCGNPPSNITKGYTSNGDFQYNGIDRLNNDLNYTKDNCVTCCFKCNWMKRDLSIQEFKEHILKLAKRIDGLS